MAIYPGAVNKLINPGSSDPPIIVIGVILHVDAGDSASLYNYFKNYSGGIESHFHIPKARPVEQYRDTGREADANYKANSFIRDGKRYGFISVETQGLERGEWNAYQIAEIKKLLLWAHKTHGVPLRRCPAWNAGGVGYHTMWGAPSQWTPVSKSCPGPDRIRQFNNVIVPWLKTAGATTPPEDDMPWTEEQLRAMMQAENEEYARRFWVDPTGTGTALIKKVDELQEAIWNEQIPDVMTPESGDTAAARTHLTWMPQRVADQVMAALQPQLDDIKQRLQRIEDDTDDGIAEAPKA